MFVLPLCNLEDLIFPLAPSLKGPPPFFVFFVRSPQTLGERAMDQRVSHHHWTGVICVCKLLEMNWGRQRKKSFFAGRDDWRNIVLCEIDKQKSCLFPWWREARL